MGWIIAIIVGGIAGWLASIVMKRDGSQGIILNVVVGIIGGFFGMGGAWMVTPGLNILGFPMAFAIGTDIAHMAGKSLISTMRHGKFGNVDYKLGLIMLAGTVIGFEVGAQVCEGGPVELVLGIEVVARLGHREADDARGRVCPRRNQRGQVVLVGDDALDRFNDGIAALALGRDGLERVAPALRLQRRNGVGHVGAQVAACDGPARVALLAQCVNVNGLVGAVERAQAQVQDEIHGA